MVGKDQETVNRTKANIPTHIIIHHTSGTSQHDLLCSLGRCVNQAAPPQSQHLSLLNAVWKLVTRIPDTSHYLTTAGVWLEFTAKHFTVSFVARYRSVVIGTSITAAPIIV